MRVIGNARLEWLVLLCSVGLLCTGCPQASERNAFLTYAETFGLASPAAGQTTGGAQGSGAAAVFRQPMTLTLANVHPTADLETSFVAWVELSSVRSGEQQDALIADGYVQLTRQTDIGSAYMLPVGTFVRNGNGPGGATSVRLPPGTATGGQQGGQAEISPAISSFTFLTADQILVFLQPPVSCDSVAFTFSVDGTVIGGPSTATGGYKTLAQVDVYECSPFRPGLFLNVSGQRKNNEYLEGDTVTVSFSEGAVAGAFATVTVGAQTQP